ncbi:MAG: FkbM family methyltransferase [Chthoniobacterales bacterium]|nr:FkbM family methyltransferase [Chthoniobacterales bacterium]
MSQTAKLPAYRQNKLRTLREIVSGISNWPTAVALRLFRSRPGLRLLEFRNGLNVICRRDTRDWDVIHELFFAGSYGRAMRHLESLPGEPIVLDLGGNIGLFSLLAASTNKLAKIAAFEPGPPNYRLFETNRLINPALTDRIELRRCAVGGIARTMAWAFDEKNPGGSSLFSGKGPTFPVEIVPFREVVSSFSEPIALVKMDIEGAEYEILANTPPEIWERVRALSLELHDDPERKVSQDDFLSRLQSYGFHLETESVCSYFLSRPANPGSEAVA